MLHLPTRKRYLIISSILLMWIHVHTNWVFCLKIILLKKGTECPHAFNNRLKNSAFI